MTRLCILCGKPAATKVRLRYCWHCYWMLRPEEYAKKKEYNETYKKRLAKTKYHTFTGNLYCTALVAEGERCMLSKKTHKSAAIRRDKRTLQYLQNKGVLE